MANDLQDGPPAAAPTEIFVLKKPKNVARPTMPTASSPAGPSGRNRQYWDRQKGETQAAYELFCVYRDAGAKRSISKVFRDRGSKYTNDWPAKFRWTDRAEAFDIWSEKKVRAALERQKLAMAQRQAGLGKRMQDVAALALGMDPETGEANNEFGAYIAPESVQDVCKLVDVGSRVERLALGESTERQDTGITFKWGAPLPSWAPPVATIPGSVIEGSTSVGPDAHVNAEKKDAATDSHSSASATVSGNGGTEGLLLGVGEDSAVPSQDNSKGMEATWR